MTTFISVYTPQLGQPYEQKDCLHDSLLEITSMKMTIALLSLLVTSADILGNTDRLQDIHRCYSFGSSHVKETRMLEY